MNSRWTVWNYSRSLLIGIVGVLLAACAMNPDAPAAVADSGEPTPQYVIGPTDGLQIFVWRNPELSTGVTVRPDGRISVPLIEDLDAAGKTPTQLAREMEKILSEFVQDPVVTVIVSGFVGPFDQQIRVVGEATEPRAIQYRSKMTALDAIIEVNGLTEFAAGNRAVIVRIVDGKSQSYRVRLDDLIKDGDVTANVEMLPGDILIIPESWF